MDSVNQTLDQYRKLLAEHARGTLKLQDYNFDTGEPIKPGTYSLADETYARLLDRLDSKPIPDDLRADILAFYSDLNAPLATKKDRKAWEKVLKELAALKAASPAPATE